MSGCLVSAAAQSNALPELRGNGDAELQRGLEQVVHELGLVRAVDSKQLSVALVDVTWPATPRLAMLNGDETMYAASLPKIAILFSARWSRPSAAACRSTRRRSAR